MKKTDRISKIEENLGGIDPKLQSLVDAFSAFRQALAEGDRAAALHHRQAADRWFRGANGRFRSLAYLPPEGSGIDLNEWHRFVKFSFMFPPDRERLRTEFSNRNSK